MMNMTQSFLSVIVVLSAVLTADGYATDLNQVLEKHLDALGSRDSIEALSSIASRMTITINGVPGQAAMLMEFPDRYYDRLEIDFGVYESGFDGVVGWLTDPNGFTRRQSIEELKSSMNQLYFNSLSYVMPGCVPGSTLYVGDTTVDRAAYHHLKLYPHNGDSLSVLIHVKTGRVEYTIDATDETIMVTTYDDFRTVSGISLPFHSATRSPDGPYALTLQVDSIVLNGDIPDSIFVMPGNRIDYRFDDGLDSIVMPISYRQSGLIVQAKVNGRGPFPFLLDTGASMSVIAKRLAGKLNIDTDEILPSRGIGGFDDVGLGHIDSIRIGRLSWRLSHISIFDFTSIGPGDMEDVDGVLGYDFFVRFPVRIDFSRMELVIFNPEARFEPSGEAVPLSIFRGIPIIEGSLDGVPTRLGLDLGAGSALIIRRDSRWFVENGKRLIESGTPTSLRGMGGTVDAISVPVEILELGSISIEETRALIATGEGAHRYPKYIEGLMGIEVLKMFDLFIQYPEQRVIFMRGDK